MKSPSKSSTKPKVPRGRRGAKAKPTSENQATVEEFDEEGLGIAAKE